MSVPFTFKSRESDSSLVEGIWHTESIGGGSFISTAVNQFEIVITKVNGKTSLTLRGPETVASLAPIPVDAEIFGIIFKPGTFLPKLPMKNLVDASIDLPEECHCSVYLCDESWEIPTYDNADTFLKRLEREGLIYREPLVEAVLKNQLTDVSQRTIQRRFLAATGLTLSTYDGIERAKHAISLLEQGMSILDTVYEAGYADQPHLTRSLKHFAGRTPAEIIKP